LKRILALERIFEAGGHRGDVAQPGDLAAGAQAQFADVL
jgi:hypothetical protein